MGIYSLITESFQEAGHCKSLHTEKRRQRTKIYVHWGKEEINISLAPDQYYECFANLEGVL